MKRIIAIVALSLLCSAEAAEIYTPNGMTGGSVNLTTSSAQTAAIASGYAEAFVDVTCSVDCYLAFGVSPTAVVPTPGTPCTCYFQSAGQTYRHQVNPGDKVAGILATGTGLMTYHAVRKLK